VVLVFALVDNVLHTQLVDTHVEQKKMVISNTEDMTANENMTQITQIKRLRRNVSGAQLRLPQAPLDPPLLA